MMSRLSDNSGFQAGPKIPGITGVILAGGTSSRMGKDKSLLPVGGARLIDRCYSCLHALFEEVLLVTNTPGLYEDLPCRKVPDIYPAGGALAGIHAGVKHARFDAVLVVGCDMPYLSSAVLRHICGQARRGDVIIPRSDGGLEPLHALYRKTCLPAIEEVLEAGGRKIVRFFPAVKVVEIPLAELNEHDPGGDCFRNINTPEEYLALCDEIGKDTLPGRLPGKTGEGAGGRKERK